MKHENLCKKIYMRNEHKFKKKMVIKDDRIVSMWI